MNNQVFIAFVCMMIVLGAVRMWTMVKLASRVPAEKRREVFQRFSTDKTRSPEDWERELGAGAAVLIKVNRAVTLFGLVTIIAFAASMFFTSFLN